jgi:hypothetical protein
MMSTTAGLANAKVLFLRRHGPIYRNFGPGGLHTQLFQYLLRARTENGSESPGNSHVAFL